MKFVNGLRKSFYALTFVLYCATCKADQQDLLFQKTEDRIIELDASVDNKLLKDDIIAIKAVQKDLEKDNSFIDVPQLLIANTLCDKWIEIRITSKNQKKIEAAVLVNSIKTKVGKLAIESIPIGAELEINNKKIKFTTNCTIWLLGESNYIVKISKNDYKSEIRKVYIQSGEINDKISVSLQSSKNK